MFLRRNKHADTDKTIHKKKQISTSIDMVFGYEVFLPCALHNQGQSCVRRVSSSKSTFVHLR